MTPISIDPAHLVTTLSNFTSKGSLVRNGRHVKTTPLLKSSKALENCYLVKNSNLNNMLTSAKFTSVYKLFCSH